MKISAIKMDKLLIKNVMSIQELSANSKVSKVTISRMRSGKQEARTQTLGKICKALNCKVEDLI